MRRYNVCVWLAVLVWFISMPAYGADIIEMPAPKDGDRWEFKATTKEGITSTTDILEGNYEIVFLQGRLEVFHVVDGQKVGTSATATDQLKRMIAFGQDELQLLNFPLSVGKKWTAEYRHTQAGRRKPQQRWATFQVEKIEEIKVGAATFQALRIKGTGQTHGGTVTREWDYLYSPDTKSLVKFFYDSGVGTKSGKTEVELTKFSPSSQ